MFQGSRWQDGFSEGLAYWPTLRDGLLNPPGVYWLLLAMACFVGVWIWRARRRSRVFAGDDVRERLRQARKARDFARLGELYESIGQDRKALKAYRRGGCHRQRAELLERLGKSELARREAFDAQAWEVYAELCERADEFKAAGETYSLLGRPYEAGRCFEAAGERLLAARAYLEAGVGETAVRLLEWDEGAEAADLLEQAIRGTWNFGRAAALPSDPEVALLRRCVQGLVEGGHPERAFQLAADTEQWELTVPLARDHLPASVEAAEACVRAGAHLVAAELFARLDEPRREALQRAEHHQRSGNREEAARWFEKAEEWDLAAEHWAASGHPARAAELYETIGDWQQAGALYGLAGETAKQDEAEQRLAALESRLAELDEPGSMAPPAAEPSMPVFEGLAASESVTALPSGQGAMPWPEFAEKDRYQLEEEVGRGGMGVVFRALDRTLERSVALKLLLGEVAKRPEAALELLGEARAIAKLSHPNIVQVYDAGVLPDGGVFIAMEWIAGQNLAQLLEARRLSIQGVILLGRQICAALAHAHGRRIVHRDLKPSNLLFSEETEQIKLTDFGLARVLEVSVNKVVTRPAGTPYYMSPEQIRGDAIDARADLYSLGCVLFEMLCGTAPFEGGGPSIYHHLNSTPRDPRELCPDAPDALADLVLRCLAKEPHDRPSSAAALDLELAAL